MSPLPVVSGRACMAALSKVGYRLIRQKGSHARLACEGRASVTVPLHGELDRGTLKAILRTAGVAVHDFVALLD